MRCQLKNSRHVVKKIYAKIEGSGNRSVSRVGAAMQGLSASSRKILAEVQ